MRHDNKTSRVTVLFNIRFISSRIFENVTPNKPFASNSFLSANNNLQSSHFKN